MNTKNLSDKGSQSCSLLVRAVKHRCFSLLISFVIVVNTVTIGVEADQVDENEATRRMWDTLEVVFTVVYSVELALRLIAGGRECSKDNWFLFDFSVTASSIVVMIFSIG